MTSVYFNVFFLDRLRQTYSNSPGPSSTVSNSHNMLINCYKEQTLFMAPEYFGFTNIICTKPAWETWPWNGMKKALQIIPLAVKTGRFFVEGTRLNSIDPFCRLHLPWRVIVIPTLHRWSSTVKGWVALGNLVWFIILWYKHCVHGLAYYLFSVVAFWALNPGPWFSSQFGQTLCLP